eukprot:8377349-Pyramimonas_sp.AAC.1
MELQMELLTKLVPSWPGAQRKEHGHGRASREMILRDVTVSLFCAAVIMLYQGCFIYTSARHASSLSRGLG